MRTLKLGSTEIFQNLLPIRGIVVTSQVGLELAAENLQGRALSNTVCADQTQHLARTRHWQPVQLEAVGGITMCYLSLEIGGQVDDVDGAERALLRADTTTNA